MKKKYKKITENIITENKTIKPVVRKSRLQKIILSIVSLLISTGSISIPVFATAEVVANINIIYTLVSGIIGAIGAITLLYGIFEWASAYQQHDSSQMTVGLKKIVSGLIMVAATAIIALFS